MACPSCKYSGLYIGIAEKDGAAIVCRDCDGMVKPSYMLPISQIKRVFLYNPGIGIGKAHDIELEDFGGMDYSEWLKAKPFTVGTEMRKYSCPAWYYQGANSELKPSFDICIGAGSFSQCAMFSAKDECWMRWDHEIGRYLKDGVIEEGKFVLLPTPFIANQRYELSDEDKCPVI